MGSTFNDPVVFTDVVTCDAAVQFLDTVVFPAGSITNAAIIASAEITESKLRHRHSKQYVQDSGADVVTATKMVHLARAAGSLHSVRVRPITAPTAGDKQYTVNVQRVPNASGTPANLLTSALVVNSSSVNNTQQSGALVADPSISAGDLIQIVVTASGTTGSQGQGVIVELQINESGL